MLQFLKDYVDQVSSKVKQVNPNVNLADEMPPSLFQTSIYTKYVRQKLINKLNQFVGKKVLVIDHFVGDMLNLVIESMAILKENGIDEIYYIDSDQLDVDNNQIIFFVNSDRTYMKRIVRIIRNNQLSNQNKKYLLIFCPRINIICKDYLEKEAVLGDVILTNFNFDLIPLGNDLLSLEVQNCLKPLYIYQDLSLLQIVAESIQRMELVHGKFAKVFAKGNLAKNVVDILKQKQQQIFEDEVTYKKSKMHTIFIVDRKVDLITPMLTPFTYEALVDEFFTIKQGSINLEIIKNEQALKDRPKKMKLNDLYFQQIKIMNIKMAMRILEEKRQTNKQVIQQLKQQETNKNMAQMSEFLGKVRQLPKEQNIILDRIIVIQLDLLVTQYINKEIESILFNMRINQEVHAVLSTKSQQIEQMIENLINLGAPITKVFRLLSVYNQIQNGMKSKQFDFYRREILHMYGVEHIITIENCEKMGLLGKKLPEFWEKIEKPLRLINEDVNHDTPEDFSYVYLAYAPIMYDLLNIRVRIFEEIIAKGTWGPQILQTIKDIPGDVVIQQNKEEEDEQIYVIYFIGGVTLGEIAAIRWLALRYKKDIQICTTHIINGDRLIQEMMQNQ